MQNGIVYDFGDAYKLVSFLAKHTEWANTAHSRYDITQIFKDPHAELTCGSPLGANFDIPVYGELE